jgi:hypothetical protein
MVELSVLEPIWVQNLLKPRTPSHFEITDNGIYACKAGISFGESKKKDNKPVFCLSSQLIVVFFSVLGGADEVN